MVSRIQQLKMDSPLDAFLQKLLDDFLLSLVLGKVRIRILVYRFQCPEPY
jgi:hypothetical protein